MVRRLLILVLCIFVCACTESPAPQERESPPTPLGLAFEPVATGTIRGQVAWKGAVPPLEEHRIRHLAYNPHLHKNPARFVMPHVPQVHPGNQGIHNAVVYLRGIEAGRSKTWDHPKVSVEFQDRQLRVVQGDLISSVGFVRRGDELDIVNRDDEYHNLHVRGAAFFAVPLIKPNKPQERKLTQAGVVELSCGAGYYWLHGHVFVCDHPYIVRTDADGRFTLAQVPAGDYEVVCWLPSWRVLRKEVEPETGITARLAWEPPQEQIAKLRVDAGRSAVAEIHWTRSHFAKR